MWVSGGGGTRFANTECGLSTVGRVSVCERVGGEGGQEGASKLVNTKEVRLTWEKMSQTRASQKRAPEGVTGSYVSLKEKAGSVGDPAK